MRWQDSTRVMCCVQNLKSFVAHRNSNTRYTSVTQHDLFAFCWVLLHIVCSSQRWHEDLGSQSLTSLDLIREFVAHRNGHTSVKQQSREGLFGFVARRCIRQIFIRHFHPYNQSYKYLHRVQKTLSLGPFAYCGRILNPFWIPSNTTSSFFHSSSISPFFAVRSFTVVKFQLVPWN